jgi:hypothetical protein
MGGTTKSTTTSQQQSQLTPYQPAAGGLNDILSSLNPYISNINGTPTTNQAYSQLIANAQGPNPFTAPAQAAGLDLLGGPQNYGSAGGILSNAYANTQNALSPYTSGNALDPNSNPALAQELSAVGNTVRDTVNPVFSAAGRLASPDNAKAIASGITQAATPLLQNAAGNQLSAINSLQGAAGSTAGGLNALDATRAGILSQGLASAPGAYSIQNLAPEQLLAVGQSQQQAPAQMAGLLSSIYGPIAAQFGQQNQSGQSNTTNQMSGAAQFATLMQGINSLFGAFKTGGTAGSFPSFPS